MKALHNSTFSARASLLVLLCPQLGIAVRQVDVQLHNTSMLSHSTAITAARICSMDRRCHRNPLNAQATLDRRSHDLANVTSLARSTMALRFRVDTLCAISPANDRLCIISISKSLMFETTNFLKPADATPRR